MIIGNSFLHERLIETFKSAGAMLFSFSARFKTLLYAAELKNSLAILSN